VVLLFGNWQFQVSHKVATTSLINFIFKKIIKIVQGIKIYIVKISISFQDIGSHKLIY
jgi:hypothetical protein